MVDDSAAFPEEQERHRLAFEEFHALGVKRTYQQVAAKLGVSASTVKLWSRTFDWRQRIRERDTEQARQIADRSLQTSATDTVRNQKIVKMALVRLAKAIAEGKVRMQMGDLDRLIKLEAFLSGGQTDQLEWIDRETDPEKLRVRLRAIAASIETADELSSQQGESNG